MNSARNIITYGVGEVGSRIPLIVMEIYLASKLGPALYGIWAIIQSAVLYGNFLHFGAVPALARREPALRVEKNHSELTALRSATYGFQSIVVGSVFGLGLIFLWLTPDELFETDNAPSIILMSMLLLTVFLQQIQITAQSSAINGFHFRIITKCRLIFAGTFLVLSVIAAQSTTPIPWLLGAWSASLLMTIALIFTLIPSIRAIPELNISRSKDLVRDGFPIFSQNIMRLLLATVDKLLVWKFASSTLLGVYSLGALVAGINTMLISIVCRTSLPNLLKIKSEEKSDFKLISEFDKTLTTGLCLAFCGAVGAGFFGPLVITFFLPKYIDGYWTTTLLSITGVLLGFSAMCADIALYFGYKYWVVITTIIGIMGYISLLVIGWLLIGSINISAITAVSFSLIYSLSLSILCYKSIKTDSRIIMKYVMKYFFISIALTTISIILTKTQIILIAYTNTSSILYWTFNGIILILFTIIAIYLINKKIKLA